MKNINQQVVNDFGKEWSQYDQGELSLDELKKDFNRYFSIFPFEQINKNSVGFDMGCGSGRWAKLMASKCGLLNCIDPSTEALKIAKNNLKKMNNISFLSGSVDDNILPDNSQDFGYCLGVLHHVPDTFIGLQSCSRMLKKGAPFLLYLYYNFENKPVWFKIIWKCINIIRVLLCKLPFKIKKRITSLIAFFVYWPLARFSLVMEKIGLNIHNIPLSSYRWKSFYSMRTDALDRFGTKIEKRFTKKDIKQMLNDAGFERVIFSESTPFWVCVAYKS